LLTSSPPAAGASAAGSAASPGDQIHAFGSKLADPKFLSVFSESKMYVIRKFSGRGNSEPEQAIQLQACESFQIFKLSHKQNVRRHRK
jgi:hypothetical protein